MATGTIILPILATIPDDATPPTVAFTADNRPYLAFSTGADEQCHWVFRMPENYASALAAKIVWGADTATSGDVIWAVQVMAVTPETDSADVATESYDTANTGTDTHLGTTAGRPHAISITLTNADSVAAVDYVSIRLYRDGDAAGDTMTGDAFLHAISLEYTTT